MANKKLKIDKTIIFNCVTLLISMAALIVSIRSCKVSDDRLKYIQAVDELKITPTLREVVDSDKVVFNASYDNAEVTALRIIFPNKVTDDVIDVRRTPIEVSKLRLENDVRAYIQENIELKDSVITFAEISIPVAVDFLATVYSVPMINRELRTLLFTLYGHDGVYDIEYSNSMLSGKIQIPDSGKEATGYWLFGDEKDIQEFLSSLLSSPDTSCTGD